MRTLGHIPRVGGVVLAACLQLPDAEGVHADVIWHQPYCEHGDVDLVVHDDQGHERTARSIVRPRCGPAAGQSGRGPGLSVLR